MSTDQFTPGPWRILRSDGFSAVVGNAHGEIVTPTGPSIPDARLIAAAPNMLNALRRAALALAFAAETSPAMRDAYDAVSKVIEDATRGAA